MCSKVALWESGWVMSALRWPGQESWSLGAQAGGVSFSSTPVLFPVHHNLAALPCQPPLLCHPALESASHGLNLYKL